VTNREFFEMEWEKITGKGRKRYPGQGGYPWISEAAGKPVFFLEILIFR
jgi:hypothetical protein